MLDDWVNGGGNLIAMRPDKQLAALLGLTDAGTTLADGYLRSTRRRAPGLGIVGADDAVPRHGRPLHARAARRRGRCRDALLECDHRHDQPRRHPAHRGRGGRRSGRLHLRPRPLDRLHAPGQPGLGGRGARRREPDPLGRPLLRRQDRRPAARLGEPRQGGDPAGGRAAASARQPDPADERGPQAAAAVLVLPAGGEGGRGHGRGQPRRARTSRPASTAEEAASPAGCSVAGLGVHPLDRLHLRRGLSDDATAKQWEDAGFEVALHVNTNCANWTPTSLAGFFTDQIADFFSHLPVALAPATHRTHCIAWSDWATQPKVELANGIRLDTNYYYWPPDVGGEPAGLLHRLRHADALRRPRRHDDRRLPGHDADDRRVGPDLPVHDRHPARPRHRLAGLLRGLHREHPRRRLHREPGGGHRRLGAGPRRPRRLREADAHLARRPQRLVVRGHLLERRRADLRHRGRGGRERPAGDAADHRGGAVP